MSELQRVDALVARIEQLEAHLERIERDRHQGDRTGSTASSAPVSRRRLLGLAGAAAAGAAGAAIATASPVGAATGAMQFGADNDATTAATTLTSSHATATMVVSNTGTGSGFLGQTSAVGAIDTGVQGDATGTTGTTFGVHGTNASTGPASAGVQGDASALTGTTFGVRGLSSSSAGTGVFGGAATGVSGRATSGAGVTGLADTGSSLEAQGPTLPNSGGAHLSLLAGNIAGAPSGGAHTTGDFFLDSAGVLFQCVATGTPGTWVRQLSFVPLAAPSRVYDSRVGQPNPSGSTQGTLAFGAAARTINCTPAVPSGATSILFNLTATGTAGSGAGALLVWAAGVTEPLSSSINWSGAGQTLANGVTSGCSSTQQVQVKCVASTGSSTHLILDVIGYYR